MQHIVSRAALVCAAAVLAIMVSMSITAQDKDAPPKPKTTSVNVPKDLVDKITKAAPEKATAKPVAKRKLLAYTRSVGYRHDTIPICAKMLEIMGEKTGAWETVISDDPSLLNPDNLKQFDGIFFCVTTGDTVGREIPPEPAGLRRQRQGRGRQPRGDRCQLQLA